MTTRSTDVTGRVLGTVLTVPPILPGGSTHVTLAIPIPAAPSEDFVLVDSATSVAECDQSNNDDDIAGTGCLIVQ